MSEGLLGELRHWFEHERTWTKKTVRNDRVHIYEKSSSPKQALGGALFVGAWAAGCFIPAALFYFKGTASTLDSVILGLLSLLPTGFGLLLTIGIANYTAGWVKNEFGEKAACERCGLRTKYLHELEFRELNTAPGRPAFFSEEHEFCSLECRETWEREQRDYDDQSWYEIQTEADKEAYEQRLMEEFYEEQRGRGEPA